MDQSLLTLINQNWSRGWLDVVMVTLTTAGLAFCALLTLWHLVRAQRQVGISLLVAQSAALLGAIIFYALAARARPDAVRLVMIAPPVASFPSGHAAIAAATVTAWWLTRGWSRSTAALLALAVGIGYSRIYLGHHYPTDVLAGLVWGVGAGAAAYGVTHFWGNRRRMLSWLLWPQVSLALMVTMMAYLGLLPLYYLSWPYSDKVLHMMLIGALAFWLNLWMPEWRVKMGRFLLPVAVALCEEILQSWSPLRTPKKQKFV